ncbi:hypothetical protein [Paenarthrobacter sp. PH39-S1]|uniref:hypothetical protein n=1 Tax=Paenarthrobacter sp. PH39-S1 TaxID=3046204 RepID=UPI0024B90350|nr:hypothetical protein [Paenarthrobacter sp. PH39-S1]MDJ0355284.1 hypothetical protein [Paenarthrobacter sp. PH39-S1]
MIKTESTRTDGSTCGCDSCAGAELAANPFVALRVAYGMLLGEDDFHALMANPRGKLMLHQAWLHGTGVVQGLDVRRDGTRNLKILPGLAVDGAGRELYQGCTATLDVRLLLDRAGLKDPEDCSTEIIDAYLVASFDACPSSAVPVLADPCDVTRKHDEFSRINEQVTYSLRTKPGPAAADGYHRVRVLLGLDPVKHDDDAGREALAARKRAAAVPPEERAGALLREFRRLAAQDEIELEPARKAGDSYPTLFPAEVDEAGVVLAAVVVNIRDTGGTADITVDVPDTSVRNVLLPSNAIQELVCGLAPALIGGTAAVDGGGPRVTGDAELRDNEQGQGRRLSFAVTADVLPASLRRAIVITSLSERGWVEEDIDSVRYEPKERRVIVELADRPINDLVRLIVRGTGPTPVYGDDPRVPLAGRAGDPPGTAENGHDAVLTLRNPLANRRAGS